MQPQNGSTRGFPTDINSIPSFVPRRQYTQQETGPPNTFGTRFEQQSPISPSLSQSTPPLGKYDFLSGMCAGCKKEPVSGRYDLCSSCHSKWRKQSYNENGERVCFICGKNSSTFDLCADCRRLWKKVQLNNPPETPMTGSTQGISSDIDSIQPFVPGRQYSLRQTVPPPRTFGSRYEQGVPISFSPHSEKATTQQTSPPSSTFGARYEQSVANDPFLSGSFSFGRPYTQQQTAPSTTTFGARFEQGVPVDRGLFHSYSDGGQYPQERGEFNERYSPKRFDSPESSSLDFELLKMKAREEQQQKEQECLRELKTTCNVTFSDDCNTIFIVATAYLRDFSSFVINFSLPYTVAGIKALSVFTECFVVSKKIIELNLNDKVISLKPGIDFPKRSRYLGFSSLIEEDVISFLSVLERCKACS